MSTLSVIITDFEENRPILIKTWLQDKKILQLFNKYDIPTEYFIKHFAFAVVDYYIDVVKQKATIGSCPAINDLMEYLKIKNVTAEDLFLICNGFKKAIMQRTETLNVFSFKVYEALTSIYGENFFGVLKEYSKQIMSVHDELAESLNTLDKYMITSRTNLSGDILEVSEPFCQLCGYNKEELIGKNHRLLRHPDTPESFYDDLWKTIQEGKTWQGEMKNLTKDKKPYWVYATIRPHMSEDGKILYYDAIRQDITSKKMLEDQHHMLVEQSKAAAMGEMISMIAHQWRQPLQAISILVQKLTITRLLEEELTDELLDSTAKEITKQLTYMSTTIDDFRDFFKPSKAKERIEISQLVNRTISFLSYMFKMQTINVVFEKQEDCVIETFDKEIIQVLVNIMKNAKDALSENDIKNRVIIIRYWSTKEDAFIEIEDNAKGIPESLIDKIFEPYFTTKESKNGTGLGLYMSKIIIEQHCHGNLSVQNGERGAVFRIKLPLKS